MFYTYQIIIWLIFLLFISSKIKKKNRRILFTAVVSFFSTLEIAAVYMTEKFIDYRFYNHMNLNAIEGHGFQFISQFISFMGLYIFLSIIFYFISKKMNSSILRHNKFFLPVILVLFILLSLPNGIFSETYKIYEILDAEEKSFNQALTDVGISPKKYIIPDQLTAEKGKNIIVISIESLEQGFLGKAFDNITPNLTRLSKKWTYYDQMSSSPGGGWTAASLYNHQVGMPAFFKGQGNAFFQGSTNVKLTGLGHVLNEAGYNSKYIVGNAEFAGMEDILNAYGIQTVSQNNALGKYPKVHNGFHDYDLFQEAKLQIKEFQKDEDKPFALFLSTINTHFPKGIYDQRMEQFISKNDNSLEFSVSAVDYLVNDFLVYLQENNLLENTAIYIFPDHLLMGSSSDVHDKLAESTRKLYLLTNVDEKKLPKQTSNTIYQIDLPRMIIDGASIKTNANFLVDFIDNDNVDEFLNKNRVKLTTLNTASVIRKNYQSGININIIDNNLTIYTEEDTTVFTLSSDNEIFDMTFNANMVLIEKNIKNNYRAFKPNEYDKKHHWLHMSIFLKNRRIEKVCFGNLQAIGICKYNTQFTYTQNEINAIKDGKSISFSYLYNSYIKYITEKITEKIKNSIAKRLISLNSLIESFQKDETSNNLEANLYGKNANRFIAHAGGQIDGYKYTNSLEALNLNYQKGFRLFELDIIKTSDDIYVAAHDWKQWAKSTGYVGDLPPDRQTFKEHKIYKKYTSMDMSDINQWFMDHPDVILVTDKVNTPIDFSNKFIDKKRLMMELFSWDAVKKGISAKIKSPMPTGGILGKIKGDKISYLKELGITDIASSRRIINGQKAFIKSIVDAGINIYAFHLHFDKGKDEKYVVCEEQKYFYGMYADKWDFNAFLDCSNK